MSHFKTFDAGFIEAEIWRLFYQESNTHKINDGVKKGCLVDGCNDKKISKGLCNAHYLRSRAGKAMDVPLRNRKIGLQCVECGNKIDKKGGLGRCSRHYRSHRRKIMKGVCVSILGGCCQRCEKSYPIKCYDFHHIGNKSDNPSEMFSNSSISSISKELSQCVLLCANCHRIEHDEQL